MRVKSLHKDNYYDKQMRAPGDEYEMDDREEANARILQTLGKLEILEYPKPNVGGATKYQSAAMTTSDTEQPQAQDKTQDEMPPMTEGTEVGPMTTEGADALTGNRRVYRRRDMKAEDK